MKLFRTAAVLSLVCVAACNSKSADPGGEAPATGINAGAQEGEISAIPAYNLGDVEVATRVALQVATQSLTPAVQYEELGTLREKVRVANATITGPPPAEFWIKLTVESRSAYRPEDTVYLRTEVKADGTPEPLLVKTYVVSGNELHGKPQTTEFNLMEKLNPMPDSVLLQTHVTLVWFPETSPMTVDPANPDLSKGQIQEILSNTLRINFK